MAPSPKRKAKLPQGKSVNAKSKVVAMRMSHNALAEAQRQADAREQELGSFLRQLLEDQFCPASDC